MSWSWIRLLVAGLFLTWTILCPAWETEFLSVSLGHGWQWDPPEAPSPARMLEQLDDSDPISARTKDMLRESWSGRPQEFPARPRWGALQASAFIALVAAAILAIRAHADHGEAERRGAREGERPETE